MILLHQKLNRRFKFPSKLGKNHHRNPSDSLSSSPRNFRSKISYLITQIRFEPDPGRKCFELIDITDTAFAEMVVEIDHPMTRWGEKLTDEYLDHSLNLLDLLNLVVSSVSHLNQANISISHALTMIGTSSSSFAAAAKYLKKIPTKNLSADFKFERSTGIVHSPGSDKDRVVLQALVVSEKIKLLAVSFVLSILCSDVEPYMEIRKGVVGSEDTSIQEVDSRLRRVIIEIEGKMEEVKEVNRATENLLTAGKYGEAVEELKTRLKVLGNSVQAIEKQANKLFYEVLGTRNKLIDNLRLTYFEPIKSHNPI